MFTWTSFRLINQCLGYVLYQIPFEINCFFHTGLTIPHPTVKFLRLSSFRTV